MNIILCVDKSNGMMFNNRRQSQDRAVTEKVMEICNGKKLLMSEYSAELFSVHPDIIVSNDFISQAKAEDFCFVEESEIPYEHTDDIYIFNWNRAYPADRYFTFDLKLNGFKRVKKEEFTGNSHSKITLEHYKRV